MPLLVLLVGCAICQCFGPGLPPLPASNPPELDAVDVVDVFVVGDDTEPPASYHLSRLPVEGTLLVVVTNTGGAAFEFLEAAGDPPVGDWIYDPSTNAVTFLSYVPETGSTVTFTYQRLDAIVSTAASDRRRSATLGMVNRGGCDAARAAARVCG